MSQGIPQTIRERVAKEKPGKGKCIQAGMEPQEPGQGERISSTVLGKESSRGSRQSCGDWHRTRSRTDGGIAMDNEFGKLVAELYDRYKDDPAGLQEHLKPLQGPVIELPPKRGGRNPTAEEIRTINDIILNGGQ